MQAVSTGIVEKLPLQSYVAPSKPSLVGLSRAQLAEALATLGLPPAQCKMRVQQIWHWLYVRGATRFDQMTSISKELHVALDAKFTLDRPQVVAEQISADGTRKWLMRLPGEPGGAPHEVECVYIPETDRGTLCLSSQVGCTLNCTFCHTGTQRLVRNLVPGEIVGQVMVARDRLGDWQAALEGTRRISNVVMMGMGEPLYNFEAVRDALLIVSDGEGLSISRRRITLSTAGVVPMIARAGVVVKGWHTESFSSAVLAHAPEIFRFVEPPVFQRAAKSFGGGGPPTKILVVPALPQGSEAREQSIGLLKNKGVDAVIPFHTMLADLIDQIEVNRNYQKSDLLQIIRILKNYDFFKDPQMELFKTRRRKR